MLRNGMHSITLFIALVGYAHGIDICGVVTDPERGIPVAGADVMLEKAGLSTSTDSEGKFRLSESVRVIKPKAITITGKGLSATMEGGALVLDVSKKEVHDISVFTIQGRAVLQISRMMQKGRNCISMPTVSKGVYLCRVKSASSELNFRVVDGSTYVVGSETGNITIAKAAGHIKSASAFSDVMIISKEGYLNSRIAVADPECQDLGVKIIGEGERVDIEEFKILFTEYAEKNEFNDHPDGYREITSPSFYSETGCQVFKNYTSYETIIVRDGNLYRLGIGFGGFGLVDMVTCDFNNDGVKDILYTYSWGSGIHRSSFGCFDISTGKEVPVDISSIEHLGFIMTDLALEKISDTKVEVYRANVVYENEAVSLSKESFFGRIEAVDGKPVMLID